MQIQAASLPTLYQISNDFIMVAADGALCALHIDSNDRFTRDGFITYCTKHYGTVFILDAQGNPVCKDSGTVWWQWDDASRRVVRRVVMEPTSEPEDRYSETYNRWYNLKHEMAIPDMTCDMSEMKVLFDHLMYISDNDKVGVIYFLHWLAWLWQHPEAKIPVAIMLYSRYTRIGKSILATLLANIFGTSLVNSVEGGVLHKHFNDSVEHRRIMVLNELAKADKQDSYERFKSLISEPTMEFEGKGRASRTVSNFLHWIITTNNPDCLPLMEGDGRILVMRCEALRRDNAYYKNLMEWMEGDGPEKVAGCFARWSFPADWDPYAPAPQTEATLRTQREARNGLAIFIEELHAAGKAPFDKDAGRVTGIIEQLHLLYPANLKGYKVNNKTLPMIFERMKFTRKLTNYMNTDGNLVRGPVWIWRRADKWLSRPEKDLSDHIQEG